MIGIILLFGSKSRASSSVTNIGKKLSIINL